MSRERKRPLELSKVRKSSQKFKKRTVTCVFNEVIIIHDYIYVLFFHQVKTIMHEPTPKNARSTKTRSMLQLEEVEAKPSSIIKGLSRMQSHFLVASEKLDRVTRRVIAPYAQIERKGIKEEEEKPGIYLDINRFNVFLEDTVDLDTLLFDTAAVLKTVTDSSGKRLLKL